MTDREKVIKGLECHYQGKKDSCILCPYGNEISCQILVCGDALSLLKKQEEDKPKGHWMPYEPDKRGYTNRFVCSRCEQLVSSDYYCKMIDFDCCPYCGTRMDNEKGQ